MDLHAIGQLVTTGLVVITPIVVALVKKIVPRIPSWLVPIVAVVLGTVIDVLNRWVTGAPGWGRWAPVIAAAGIGLREIVDQIRKLMARS